MKYIRNFRPKGKPEVNNALADLHDFGGKAKLVVEIDLKEAKRLLEIAIAGGGTVSVQMSLNETKFTGNLTEARMDTFDPVNKSLLSKKGQPGLCAFSALSKANP